MKANQKNSCPSCGHQFAQVDISEKFDCPTCNAKLWAAGFFAQGAFDLVAMFIFGGLFVVAVLMESLLAGILIAAIWLLTELWVRSQVIQVSLVSESTTHKPSEVSGHKQA